MKFGSDYDQNGAFLCILLDNDWQVMQEGRTSQSYMKMQVDKCSLSSASRM